MAKKIIFNGKDITVAEYDGVLFFDRTDMAKAIGYKGSIQAKKGVIPFIVGSHYLYPLEALNTALNKVQGEEPRKEVAGLVRMIYEAFGDQVDPVACESGLEQLDDLAMDWAISRTEVNTARVILEEASARESELFTKLKEEHDNG